MNVSGLLLGASDSWLRSELRARQDPAVRSTSPRQRLRPSGSCELLTVAPNPLDNELILRIGMLAWVEP